MVQVAPYHRDKNVLDVLASVGIPRDKMLCMVISTASSILTGRDINDFHSREMRNEIMLLQAVCNDVVPVTREREDLVT